MADDLPTTIRPDETLRLSFDFTSKIESSGTISSVSWACALSPENVGVDLTPASRLVGTTTTTGYVSSHLVGTMVNGCSYAITAVATVTDGRVLARSSDIDCELDPEADDGTDVLSIAEFRASLPAFTDASKYPDPAVAYWISQAALALDPIRWGQFYSQGLRLYVAHMLAINYMAGRVSGAPVGSGVPSSRSVGGVSVSYDTQFGAEEDAGNWNLTIWGSQFIRLARQAGSGQIQL
jgi:hypothetical protein